LRGTPKRLGAALAVVALAAVSAAARGRLEPPVNISVSSRDSLAPVVATDGAVVHIAWIESEATTDGVRATIFAARSADGGASFGAPVEVAPLTGYASGLAIGASAGRVHLAWLATSYTTGSPASVSYSRSTDGGATWARDATLNGETYPGIPSLAVSGDRVALVWSTEQTVWLAASKDGGASFDGVRTVSDARGAVDGTARTALAARGLAVAWISPRDGSTSVVVRSLGVEPPDSNGVPIDVGAGPAAELTLAADGDDVFLVWRRGDTIALAGSTDGGARFASLADAGPATIPARPRLVVSAGVAHLVWLDAETRLTYGRRDVASAGAFTSRRLARKASFPDLAVSGQVVSATWQAGASAPARLLVAASFDGGHSFAEPRTAARRGARASAARTTISSGVPVVAFEAPLPVAPDVFVARWRRSDP
jgi:hypothetical protein